MFDRLKADDTTRREVAWSSFQIKYGRIIGGFARKLGVKPTEIDDVVQDVSMQFFQNSQTFEYDPSRGRFRGYLKTITYRTIRDRHRSLRTQSGASLDEIDPADPRIEAEWNEVWDRERLSLAVEAVAIQYDRNRTFQAFEQHVLGGVEAEVVAQQLNMSLESVYKASQRVKQALKEMVKRMDDEA